MAYKSYYAGSSSTATAPAKKSSGYTSYFGNTVQATQAQGGNKPTKPKLSPDEQVRQAAEAGRKLGEEAKKRAEQQKSSSLFDKIKRGGKAVAEGFVEAPKKIIAGAAQSGSGMANARKAEQAAQTSNNAIIARAGKKLQDKNTSEAEKQRYRSLLDKTTKASNEQNKNIASRQKQFYDDTDVKKQLAATASVGFDIATLGVGTVGVQAAKAAAKQGGKQLTRTLIKQGVKTGLTAAPSGGLSPVIQKGDQATAKDIATGAGTAFAIGAALPGGAYGVNKVAGKVSSKAAKELLDKVSRTPDAKQTPQPGDVITPDTQKAVDTIMSKVKPSAKVVKEQADVAQQAKLADEQAVKVQEEADKAITETKKIDDKIELINAKKADDKFTNVDKTKVSQLEAQKAELAPTIKQAETTTQTAFSVKSVENSNKLKLADVINHDELFNKYPTLKNVDVRLVDRSQGSGNLGGDYIPGGNGRITIGKNGWDIKNGKATLNDTGTRNLFHEIEHAKQELNAKPGMMLDKMTRETQAWDAAKKYGDKHLSSDSPTPAEALPTSTHAPPTKQPPILPDAAVPVLKQAEPGKAEVLSSPKPITADKPLVETPKPGNSRVYERMQAEHSELLEGNVKYDKIRLQDESDKAVELIAKDKQQAYRIAMGVEESSTHRDVAVNIALSEKALEEGNDTLAAQLIKTRSLAQTRKGQDIAMEKMSVTDNSASRYVKELIATRLEKLGKNSLSGIELGKKTLGKTKSRGLEVIDREVAKAEKQVKNKSVSIQDAQAILDKLSC